MQIRCMHCGHNFKLDEAYDNYEGEVRCWVCGAIQEIKLEEGMLKYSRCVKSAISLSKETV